MCKKTFEGVAAMSAATFFWGLKGGGFSATPADDVQGQAKGEILG
jgi:hypothetical protein